MGETLCVLDGSTIITINFLIPLFTSLLITQLNALFKILYKMCLYFSTQNQIKRRKLELHQQKVS